MGYGTTGHGWWIINLRTDRLVEALPAATVGSTCNAQHSPLKVCTTAGVVAGCLSAFAWAYVCAGKVFSCTCTPGCVLLPPTWLEQFEAGPQALVVCVPGLDHGLDVVKELPVEPPALDAPLGEVITCRAG